MSGQIIGYRRVSSEGQNLDRQLDGLQLNQVFEEKISGKDTNRPELQRLIEYARKGDIVVVHSLDRLGAFAA
jgi:DNA invertase Pin-like site-specific DNA recombinase